MAETIDNRQSTIDNSGIGPFCGVCGDAADRLIRIDRNCCYDGWGRLVCEDCCAMCDLRYGCAAYAGVRRQAEKKRVRR